MDRTRDQYSRSNTTAKTMAKPTCKAKPAPSIIFNAPKRSCFFNTAPEIQLAPVKSKVIEITLSTQVSSGVFKYFAARGATANATANIRTYTTSSIQNAVDKSSCVASFLAITPVVVPKEPTNWIRPFARIAIPMMPKSSGDNTLARTTLEPI